VNPVLITIVGPAGRRDAVAPAAVPVGELVATFAELVGAHGHAIEWELEPAGGPPLHSGRSLAAQGVADGSVLHLRGRGAPRPLPAADRARARVDDGSSPVRRTRDALPEWFGLATRVRTACRARGDGDGERRGRPASVRAGWRETSYERRLEQTIRDARPERPVTIAVVSPAADAGASTIALLLGSLLAHLRAEHVVVLDASRAPSPLDAEIERLRETAAMIVVDCGPGLEHDAARTAIAAADRVVAVVRAGPGGAAQVAATTAALGDDGPGAVLVVNRIAARGEDVGRLERGMPAARGLIAVHDDRRRAARLAGEAFTWARRAGAWDLPLRELAALLATPAAR
jgi:hypothetical protein